VANAKVTQTSTWTSQTITTPWKHESTYPVGADIPADVVLMVLSMGPGAVLLACVA
jgi:hypothetical protein